MATGIPDPLRILPDAPPAGSATGRYDLAGVAGVLPELIDALTDAVVVLDHQRRVVAANRRYVEAFGTRSDAVAGFECLDALNCPEAEHGAHGRCAACRALDGGGPQKLLRTHPGRDGRQRRWEVSFNPVSDSQGRVSHVVEVWRDVSDRSALEAQLAHGERLASLGTLAAGIGHEINNPLASMLTAAEVLQRILDRGIAEPGACDEARELVSLLEHEIGRARDTTDRLMLLAQPISTQPRWVDLGVAAADTLSLLRFAIRKGGLEESLEVAPGTPKLWAHDSAVRGVCMNLMLNAVQAGSAGGEVRVRVEPRGPYVALVVEDRGPGLPAENPERIWEPFFTTKPAGHGTGLGLFVTQGVVVRHGGRIRAENREGGGARFEVLWPLSGTGGE